MIYREKLMPEACASPLDKFDAMYMRSEAGSAEKEDVFEKLVDEKI